MKKLFVFAAMAALALTSCGDDNFGVEGGDDYNVGVKGIVLNELSGADKFIELYNTTDAEVSLREVYIVKYDSSKDGGKSTTWTGAKDMVIAPKGFVVLESSDLSDPAEDGDPAYAYESENHIFKGGLSGKKNVFIELYNANDEKLSEFKRGEEGAGWNQVSGFTNNKKNTFSRVPDGTGEFVYALPTKGAANGEKVADIEQTPEM
ncbi:MAG: lamin tail domain-containing protein [Tidjanibacter sp.]|nr:lamin tail domain-containing protein [Tidjanibacter sp.]